MIRKVKNWLGIEAVKVELVVPETFSVKGGMASGSVLISSQSDSFINLNSSSIWLLPQSDCFLNLISSSI